MASYLLRNVPKSNQLIRPNNLSIVNKRQSSGTTEPVKTVVESSRGRTILPLAVGLSLGLGVSGFAQTNLKKYFPSEPVPEKVVYSTEPRVYEELINSTRKYSQLESELNHFKDEFKKLAQQPIQVQPPPPRSDVDIFELSQVIEANNLANANAHKRILEEQRKSLIREHLIKVEGEVLKVENKYRPIINKIKELESHLETQQQNQRKEAPARLLWISCQSLLDRMRQSRQGPLAQDPAYIVLKKFAENNNQLAKSVLEALPAKALEQGIESEESLIDRFSTVDRLCRRVALVDEKGGGLVKYLVSYLQSLFIFHEIRVTEDEVTGKKLVDPTAWSTFDILARVRYCLQEHNLDQATRYANQLKGQARTVARDWIRDARIYLEVKEAFSALSAYAEAVAVDAASV